jgi:drug/metabolite transporter (DMT)-like permease
VNKDRPLIVVLLTALTLAAFAANSLLCRMALGGDLIDPVSFAAVRLMSGAAVLVMLSFLRRRVAKPHMSRPIVLGSWISAAALFVYAAAFSLAYVSLSAGTGALILFGSVQITMVAAALLAGERLGLRRWIGAAGALGGLVYLVLPGITAPDPLGASLMGLAGIAWGIYSLRGKGSSSPVAATAGNFLRTAPMALAASAFTVSVVRLIHLQRAGILLALISGTVTSGLGYALWYRVLRHISAIQASVLQLSVPVLAAFGGVVFLSERVSLRLAAASALILGGVALAVVKHGSVERAG